MLADLRRLCMDSSRKAVTRQIESKVEKFRAHSKRE